MQWTELAPHVYQAKGRACKLQLSLVKPEDPYRWRVELDFGLRTPIVCCAGEYAGTLEGAQVHALQLIHNMGHNLNRDAADLAASMTRTLTGASRSPALEVGA